MKLSYALTSAAGLFGLQAAMVSPALAAVDTGSQPAVLAKAPLESPVVAGAEKACANLIVPAFGSARADPGKFAASKASAILGGQVSRLELIAQQQAAAEPVAPAPVASIPTAVAKALPGEGLEPAAGGLPCRTFASPGIASLSFASPRFAAPMAVPILGRSPLGSEDFLASKRLPVSRTAFDGAWSRVRAATLPQSMVRRAAGGGDLVVTRDRIAAINSWTNSHVRYVEDRDLYGRADFWATARTTLKRRAGDCEDIAIAKMQLLAAMGVPRGDMYLTIARDLARNADHAMLVVRFEGEHLLLDNATDELLDAAQSYDYRPILSFNTTDKWLHGF